MTPPSKMEGFKPTLRVCESNLWAPQFLQWILNLLQCLKTAKNHALKHFLVIFWFFFCGFQWFQVPHAKRGFPKHNCLVHGNQHKTFTTFYRSQYPTFELKTSKNEQKTPFFEGLGPKMTPLSKVEVFKTTLTVRETYLWAPQILQWILNLLQCVKTAKNLALKHFLVIFWGFVHGFHFLELHYYSWGILNTS